MGQFHGFRRGQGEADLALQILLLEDAQQVLHPHGARLATHQPGSHHLLVLAQVVLHVGLLGAGFLKLALCGLLRSLGLLPARVEEMAYAPQHQHGHQLGHQDARQGQDGRPHQRKDHRPQALHEGVPTALVARSPRHQRQALAAASVVAFWPPARAVALSRRTGSIFTCHWGQAATDWPSASSSA